VDNLDNGSVVARRSGAKQGKTMKKYDKGSAKNAGVDARGPDGAVGNNGTGTNG